MKTLYLAAVALGVAASPALAGPGGHGHGNSGHGNSGHGDRGYEMDRHDRSSYGMDREHAANRYGRNACPPGLAKKNNGCMAPGQARRMFRQGQRVPTNYGYYTPYSNIPTQYRDQYGLDPNNRYIYRDNQIYVVDPRTSLVERIIGSLVR